MLLCKNQTHFMVCSRNENVHCMMLICFNISEVNIHHRAKEQVIHLSRMHRYLLFEYLGNKYLVRKCIMCGVTIAN